MSNETSDNSVANIEDDIKVLNELLGNVELTFGGWVDILNEREKKALKNILAEREQKDKRIKELEKENKKYIVQLTDKQYRNLVETIRKEVKQEFEQKVIEKIEEYDKKMEEDAGHPNWVVADRIVMNVLQELLEGRNENV